MRDWNSQLITAESAKQQKLVEATHVIEVPSNIYDMSDYPYSLGIYLRGSRGRGPIMVLYFKQKGLI